MKYLFSLLLFTSLSEAKPFKVAVIDSGLDGRYQSTLPLCPEGHKSFTASSWDKDGVHSHGTNIAMTIHKHAGTLPNFCLLIIKVLSNIDPIIQRNPLPDAIDYAIEQGASIINISISGQVSDHNEKVAIQRALNNDIVILVAAGNNDLNLDIDCIIYPACYKFTKNKEGFGVIGNYMEPGVRQPNSNTGKVVTKWELGTDIRTKDLVMTGTSQATAVATGKLTRRFLMREQKKEDYEN